MFKYDSVKAPPPKTRATSTESCACTVCDIARLKNFDYKKYWDSHSIPVGRPSDNVESPPAKTLALCNKCFGEIGRGKSHKCSKSQKAENLANLVKSTSINSKTKVASAAIQDIAKNDIGVSTRGGTVCLPSGSKEIPITIGTPKAKPKEPNFTHKDLMNLQASENLSDRSLL